MLKFLEMLPLTTDNLEIRLLETKDIPWYINEIKKPEFNQYQLYQYNNNTNDNVIADMLYRLTNCWDKGNCLDALRLVILEGETLVGGISIHKRIAYPFGREISYWLNEKNTGKGIVTKALNIVTLRLAEVTRETLYLSIHKDNIKSIRVAERANYKLRCQESNTKIYYYKIGGAI